MRNMKSLHIFLIIVIKKEEKFQESLWEDERSKSTLEYEKPRVKCNPKVILEIYICIFRIWEKGKTSLLILSVDQLMRADYSPHSL